MKGGHSKMNFFHYDVGNNVNNDVGDVINDNHGQN
jgi:hypothetical protein